MVLLGTDLKSFKSAADVFLLDPNGIIMRRWLSRQVGLEESDAELKTVRGPLRRGGEVDAAR